MIYERYDIILDQCAIIEIVAKFFMLHLHVATSEKGDSQRVAMNAHFQVRTFEVQTLFQVLYKFLISKCLKRHSIVSEISWANFNNLSHNYISSSKALFDHNQQPSMQYESLKEGKRKEGRLKNKVGLISSQLFYKFGKSPNRIWQ